MKGRNVDENEDGLLTFRPATQYKPGVFASFLYQCYSELLSNEPAYWRPEEEKWLRFDQDIFSNPETIGRCVFVTCLGEEEIGFASFDPRQGSEFGIVGHNCVLPCFQNEGCGRRQVLEVLERFRQRGIKRARVVTSDHPFFLPARKMYLGCGFHEKRRLIGGPDPRYELVEYEIGL